MACYDPWFHSPLLKLEVTATNKALSSFLSFLKANKEWGKLNKTTAGFSGTKDLLLPHLSGGKLMEISSE